MNSPLSRLPFGSVQCANSGILVTLRLGEAPEEIPAMLDVNTRQLPAANNIDRGPIDRIITRFAGGVRTARLHAAKASAFQPGCRHQRYDHLEQTTGVARTFLLRLPPGTPIGRLCDALSQLANIESVSPNYFAHSQDFEQASQGEGEGKDEKAWAPRHAVNLSQALAIEPGDPAVLVGLIDSGISLNKVFQHVVCATHQTGTAFGTDNTRCNGLTEAKRVTNRHDKIADTNLVGIGQLDFR